MYECYIICLNRKCNVNIFMYSSGQEREDRFYAASIQYQPGDKCFVS